MKVIIILFTLIVITTSCNSSKEAIDNSYKKAHILSGTYSVSHIGDKTSITEELSITFENTTNKITGFAGCNTFFGTYKLDQSNLIFENIASTKKFCGKEMNMIESQFIKALNTTNSILVDKNVISFLENETVLLKAKKVDPITDN